MIIIPTNMPSDFDDKLQSITDEEVADQVRYNIVW